jgi:hypothetical protein
MSGQIEINVPSALPPKADVAALQRRSETLRRQIVIQKARNLVSRWTAEDRAARAPKLIYRTTWTPTPEERDRAQRKAQRATKRARRALENNPMSQTGNGQGLIYKRYDAPAFEPESRVVRTEAPPAVATFMDPETQTPWDHWADSRIRMAIDKFAGDFAELLGEEVRTLLRGDEVKAIIDRRVGTAMSTLTEKLAVQRIDLQRTNDELTARIAKLNTELVLLQHSAKRARAKQAEPARGKGKRLKRS